VNLSLEPSSTPCFSQVDIPSAGLVSSSQRGTSVRACLPDVVVCAHGVVGLLGPLLHSCARALRPHGSTYVACDVYVLRCTLQSRPRIRGSSVKVHKAWTWQVDKATLCEPQDVGRSAESSKELSMGPSVHAGRRGALHYKLTTWHRPAAAVHVMQCITTCLPLASQHGAAFMHKSLAQHEIATSQGAKAAMVHRDVRDFDCLAPKQFIMV
jgi:hypothetical protein